MRKLTTLACVIAVMCLAIKPALARCGAQPAQSGAVSNDPEKDTVGLVCQPDVERTASLASEPGRAPVPVGASTGEIEKDTVGYVRLTAPQ